MKAIHEMTQQEKARLFSKTINEMTQQEKEKLLSEAGRLSKLGDDDGADAIYRLFPLPARYVKNIKDSFGPGLLRRMNYNYSEAEALYGRDWLDR